jgi:hypothetical protein
MVVLILVFWGISIMFSIVLYKLKIHQQYVRVPYCIHPHQHLLFVFLIDILTGVRWKFDVVLICICFLIRNTEHFLMYLFVIYTSSFENCLFICSFIHCVADSLGVYFLSFLYIVFINHLSDVYLAKIFSHAAGSLFSPVAVSFAI